MHSSRTRRWLAPALITGALVFAGCTTAPPPGTPWMLARCIDSTNPSVPDLLYSGWVDVPGNAATISDAGVESFDGTCTGDPVVEHTVVRATLDTGAVARCAEAGVPVTNPSRMVHLGYQTPIDAWLCLEDV